MRTWFKFQFNGTELARLAISVLLLSGVASTIGTNLGCTRSVALKPTIEEEVPSSLERITILGLNDFHANLLPTPVTAQVTNTGEMIRYEKGGAGLLAAYLLAAQQRYGNGLFTLVSGDLLFGSFESGFDRGVSTIQALNHLGISAAVLGPRDFDFGLNTLKSRMSEARFPFLLSNLSDSSDPTLASWPNSHRHLLLDNGKVKLGIIGLMSSHFRLAGRTYLSPEISVTDLADSTLNEAHALRQAGAQVIVLLAHVGLDCDTRKSRHVSNANHGPRSWKPETPQESCLRSGELVQLLEALPPETVDAVVSGNSQKLVHHWVRGVPVIQGGASAEYFNLIHLFYDPYRKQIRPSLTRIEGPYGICASVFASQLDCNEKKPLAKNGRGELLHASFLDHSIKARDELESIILPLINKGVQNGGMQIAEAARDIPNDLTTESAMGNLVTDAIRARLKTDFAVINPGAIRTDLHAGKITERDLFAAIPFELSLARLTLTGTQLKRLLTVLTSGARGFPSVSGLRLSVIDLQYPGRAKDLDGNHRIDHWEFDRLLGIRTSEGFQIKDQKKYTVATTDFLARGGDDLSWAISQVGASNIELESSVSLRETVGSYLRGIPKVNTAEAPLIDTDAPRIKLSLPPVKFSPRRRHRRRTAASH